MTIELRVVVPGEERAFAESVCVPFLEQANERDIEACLLEHETERCFVAVDRGRMVGNAAVLTRDVTVPAPLGSPCSVVPLAAITSVGVHPTHRRRGILGRLMGAMVDQARERGEPLAGLGASEGAIYGRFGFGVAVESAMVTLDTREVAFARPPAPLDLALLSADEAGKVLPGLLDRIRRGRPGEVSRPDNAWAVRLRNVEWPPGPAPFFAACDRGYVAYRVRTAPPGSDDDDRIEVLDLVGEDPEAEAGLWAYVTSIDLVRSVTAPKRSLGDSMRWRLTDPRAWRTIRVRDHLWLRVIDVPAALSARSYPVDGTLVLDVAGPADDPSSGRWHLSAGFDGASVRAARAGEPTDLGLGLADLGALYLGGVPASRLVAAGRVVEERPGLARLADLLFASVVEPVSSTGF